MPRASKPEPSFLVREINPRGRADAGIAQAARIGETPRRRHGCRGSGIIGCHHPAHGFVRIEAGSLLMISNTRRYLNDIDGAIAGAHEVVELAVRVSELRSEMFGSMLIGELASDQGDFAAAHRVFARAYEIANGLGNARHRAYFRYEQGRALWFDLERRDEAAGVLEEAVALARKFAPGFILPRTLSAWALAGRSKAERRAALAEGAARRMWMRFGRFATSSSRSSCALRFASLMP